MKKKLLLVCLTLICLFGVDAQTMPQLSTAGFETWYYIQFKNGGGVIQDMGAGQKLLTKTAAENNLGQLWKITSTGTNLYLLTSKLGNKMAFSTSLSRFITNAAGGNLVLKATPVTAYIPAWEIGVTSASTMNQFGGAGVEKEIGQWSSDANNPLEFLLPAVLRFPQPLPDKLTEVPLTGKAGAPAQKLALWYRFPSTNWMTSSLPIGNGEFGAMVFGGVKQDEIQFNDKTLWTGSTSKYGAYQNFGNVFINNNNVEEAVNYRRELDLENSICRVSYTNKGVNFLREYLSSNPDSAVVVRLTASAAAQISFDLMLWDPHNCKPRYNGNSVTIDGKLDLVSYYAKLTIVNDGGTVTTSDKGIKVEGANAVTIILRGATDYDPNSITYIRNTAGLPARVEGIVNRAAAKSYETLKSAHIADYKNLFNRVALDFTGTANSIPTDELAKSYNASVAAGGKGLPFLEMLYFHFGRYLMISSSRGVTQPSNLQGIWNHVNNPPWSSDIHSNINVQMNYWPAENTNLSELHKPFLNYIYNEAMDHPQWRKNALDSKKTIASKLGLSAPSAAKGWTLYTENNIFGFGSTFAMNYVVANAWYCMHSWQHYRFTLDQDYLLNNAYPVMKSCAEFWLERLIQDRGKAAGTNILKTYAPDGTLVAPLEYSPEHGPGEEDGTAHAQQLCWDLFNNTLQAMDALGDKVAVDAAFKTQLQQAFAKLDPGTAIDKDGHLREWKYTEKEAGQAGHRHTSHLMGLFPGNQISPKINKPIFDAAIKSLNARGDEGTGWSMGWRINLWARSCDAERAHKLIRGAMNLTYNTGNGSGWGGGIYENLLDAHTPFQIDGNFGATSGIAEMLLQSQTDTLDILPALPSMWSAGKVKGLRAVGNFEVDINWENMRASKVRIQSFKGKECRVAYPFIRNAKFTDKAGTVITPILKGTNCAIFPTVEGGEYFIEFKSTLTVSEIAITSTVNAGAASGAKTITVNAGDNVVLISTASVTGQRYWTGPNNLKVTTNNITLNSIKTYQSGKYYIAFVGTEGNISKDSIEVKINGEGPFANVSIPGSFDAENYDFGGEGVAFHAADATNAGNFFRTDGIDVYKHENSNYIGLNDGEWTRYTVNSTRNAKFQISVAARPRSTGSKLEILVDGLFFKELNFTTTTADFQQFSLDGLKEITTGIHTITLKATGLVDVNYLTVDHFYTTNTLVDGFYNFRVNGKSWTYSTTISDKTKPTFQTPTTADNQIWEIKKDGTRYKMTTKTRERYINEQTTFGTNAYAAAWNTFSMYSNGEKYAIQNGGSSGSEYWRFDGSNVAKLTDPGYPTNFDFELIPVTVTGVNHVQADDLKIYMQQELIRVSTSKEIAELKLISICGTVIATAKRDVINISKLPAGVYILSVKQQSGDALVKKIIINAN